MRTQTEVRSFHGGRLRMLDDFGRELLPLTTDKEFCATLDKGPCFFAGKPLSSLWTDVWIICKILSIQTWMSLHKRRWQSKSADLIDGIAHSVRSWAQSNRRRIGSTESSMVRRGAFFGDATYCHCRVPTYYVQRMAAPGYRFGDNATVQFGCSWAWLLQRL